MNDGLGVGVVVTPSSFVEKCGLCEDACNSDRKSIERKGKEFVGKYTC